MVVERLVDGSISISSIIDGRLVTERYYLDGTNKQNLREAYELFLRKHKEEAIIYEGERIYE